TTSWTAGTYASGTASTAWTATATQVTFKEGAFKIESARKDYTFTALPSNYTVAIATQAGTHCLDLGKNATPDVVEFNDVVKYTITVTNTENFAMDNVIIKDDLPAGMVYEAAPPASADYGTFAPATGLWTISTLPAKTTATLTYFVKGNQSPVITNTAWVKERRDTEFKLTDHKKGNNPCETPECNDCVTKCGADEACKKECNNSPLIKEKDVIVNRVFEGCISDDVPAFTMNVPAGCTTWQLLDGATPLYSSTTHAAMMNAAGVVTFTKGLLKIGSANKAYTFKTCNGEGTVTVKTGGHCVEVDKNAEKPTMNTGEQNKYTITVTNTDALGNEVKNLVINDKLPAGMEYVSRNPAAANYNPATGDWIIGTLAHGATVTLEITVKNTSNLGENIINTAWVQKRNETVWTTPDDHRDNTDPLCKVNCKDCAALCAGNAACIADCKNSPLIDDEPVEVKSRIEFEGCIEDKQIYIAPLPAVGSTWKLTETTGGASKVIYTSADLLPHLDWKLSDDGKSVIFTGDYFKSGRFERTYIFEAQDGGLKFEQEVVLLECGYCLEITKDADKDVANKGDENVYTITVVNEDEYGNAVTDIIINDKLPAGMDYVSHTLLYSSPNATNGNYDWVSGDWTIGTLPYKATATLKITVKYTGVGDIKNIAWVKTRNTAVWGSAKDHETFGPDPDDPTKPAASCEIACKYATNKAKCIEQCDALQHHVDDEEVTVNSIVTVDLNIGAICEDQMADGKDITATINCDAPCSYTNLNFNWNFDGVPAVQKSEVKNKTSVQTLRPVTRQPYTIKVEVRDGDDGNKVIATKDVNLVINQKPDVKVSVSSEICEGSNVTLNASGANTYSWSPAVGFTGSGASINVTTPANGAQYTVTGTDANGCKNSAIATIKVNPNPTANITLRAYCDNAFWTGDPITLSGSPSGGTAPYTHSWTVTTPAGTPAGAYTLEPNRSDPNPVLTFTSAVNPVKISYRVTDKNGCYYDAPDRNIDVKAQPTVAVLGDMPLCVGSRNNVGEYWLSKTDFPAGTEFWWDALIDGKEIMPTYKTTKVATASDPYRINWTKTTYNAEINVTIVPPPGAAMCMPINVAGSSGFAIYETPTAYFTGPVNVCEGDVSEYIATLGKQQATTTYTWDLANNLGSLSTNNSGTKATVNWTHAGTELIEMTAKNGICEESFTLTVLVHPLPQPDFTFQPSDKMYFQKDKTYRYPDEIYPGKEVQFTNETAPHKTPLSYYWDFAGDGVFTETKNNKDDVYFTYDQSGSYTAQLLAVDEQWGCRNIISKPIQVGENPNCGLKFPNAFTPDMSTNNTFYAVYNEGVLEWGYELRIYDRWGTMLWSSTDKYAHWDGIYRSEVARQDVYVYHCKAVCEETDANGNHRVLNIKGDVTVIR
ncbi:MAG: gliding motility-associated C-terminal domain-containing protein, partial [Bacteroidetes bacterium]|nr:gliding motility-associated C-terminal domain-containing protein [Bacteroidota bacterium]